MTEFYELSAKSMQGKNISMKDYEGKVVLIVNTASKCGFTPQYAGLEDLYKKYKNQGLVILGFPCNQFGNQEPGSEKEIKQGCLLNYGVTFQMFSKVDVNGDNEHPIYTFLKSKKSGLFGSKIKWNFTKFLIDKEGNVIDRFGSGKTPKSLEKNIKKLL